MTSQLVVLLGLAFVGTDAPDEIVRVQVDRPATVIVERTPDGGVRVILEYRPRVPVPSDPTDPPDDPPPTPTPQDPLAVAVAALPEADRTVVLTAVLLQIEKAIASVDLFGSEPEAIGWMTRWTIENLGNYGARNHRVITSIYTTLGSVEGSTLDSKLKRLHEKIKALR